jgi:hypothetical protein
MMPGKYERQKARRAANLAAGLRHDGRPRIVRVNVPTRDHVAEVESGLALGLDLDGIASDMGIAADSIIRALERKDRRDLVRRLGVPDAKTSAALVAARREEARRSRR